MSPLDLIPAPYGTIAKIGLPILALVGAFTAGDIHGHRAENTRLTAKYQPKLQHAADVINLSVARIAKARAEASAADLRHARAIEQNQQEVTNRVSASYQTQLADLRARYERLRAQTGTAGSGSGSSNKPVVSIPAAGFDGSPCQDGLSSQDAFIATAQALQLTKLQEWVREQAAIKREDN